MLIFHKLTLSDDVFKYKNYFYLLKKIFYSILYGGEYMSKPIVAVVGRPNVGKSTLLNRIVGQKIAIMSDKAQTTRNKIQGIYTIPEAQIVFIDTPGIHKPKHRLGDFMVESAYNAMREVDATLFMVVLIKNAGTVTNLLIND